MSVETQKETLGFQTEVKQLLHLMIHSLYSNKEIFLRELISNASDAVDKLRFEALSKPELLEGGAELKIRVSFDKDANTVTLEDNGIGMSREDAITHLGTIAKSGTADFMKNLSGDQKTMLIAGGILGVVLIGGLAAFGVEGLLSVVDRTHEHNKGVHEIWVRSGDQEIMIYATTDSTRFGQIYRALQRAIENVS